jgi:mono/diheme cytochrome c family protein
VPAISSGLGLAGTFISDCRNLLFCVYNPAQKERLMRTTLLALLFLLPFVGTRPSMVFGGSQTAAPRSVDTPAARGRYLVEEVAKCAECHTPRDADNQLDRSRWLQGASIWIQPVHRVPNWAEFAPPLAGLPGLSDEQMERVLEKGQAANGREIQPPMHLYHLNHNDALAVIAYLRSLPPPISR